MTKETAGKEAVPSLPNNPVVEPKKEQEEAAQPKPAPKKKKKEQAPKPVPAPSVSPEPESVQDSISVVFNDRKVPTYSFSGTLDYNHLMNIKQTIAREFEEHLRRIRIERDKKREAAKQNK